MPTIDQPELPPLIVNGSGAHKYVFTYKNTWDPKLKRAVRGKGDTKCVGRFEPIVGEAGYGEIIFNDEFKEQHPAILLRHTNSGKEPFGKWLISRGMLPFAMLLFDCRSNRTLARIPAQGRQVGVQAHPR